MEKSSKAKHVCFKTLYISWPSYVRNHQKLQRTHKEYKMFIFRNIQRCKSTIFGFPSYSVERIKSTVTRETNTA